jgi:hypothetical protein
MHTYPGGPICSKLRNGMSILPDSHQLKLNHFSDPISKEVQSTYTLQGCKEVQSTYTLQGYINFQVSECDSHGKWLETWTPPPTYGLDKRDREWQ